MIIAGRAASHFADMVRAMLSTLLSFIMAMAAALSAVTLYAYFRQEALIFYARPNDPSRAQQWRAQRVEIPSGDTIIEGWWADNPRAGTSALILYFGGNAEDVLYTMESAAHLDARRLLVTNYAGYGSSGGRPGQAKLFADGLAIYDYVRREGTAPENIFLIGRSLGSSVATWIAANRPVRGVILITPFDSMVAVGQRHYPFLPVAQLLRHRFPSIELAQGVSAATLMIAAAEDYIIPPAHAERLFEAWPARKEFHVLAHVGHNDVERHPDYDRLINAFLAREARQ